MLVKIKKNVLHLTFYSALVSIISRIPYNPYCELPGLHKCQHVRACDDTTLAVHPSAGPTGGRPDPEPGLPHERGSPAAVHAAAL